MSGVLLDAMERRRSMPPGGGQAVVAEVGGVRQTPLRRDVLRQIVPYFREHLAVVDVRIGQGITEHEELVHFDRGMDLDPVLGRLETVVGLPPGTLPAGEAGSVGGDDWSSLRKRAHDEVVEPLPESQPAWAGVLPAEDRMVWNPVHSKVVCQHYQETFGLPERQIEELADQEGREERTLLGRRPSGPPVTLPEWKFIGIEPDRFKGQSDLVDHDLIVHSLLVEQRIEVDEVGIDLCLPRKFEYLGRYYDICGNQPFTFLSNWQYRLAHTLIFC